MRTWCSRSTPSNSASQTSATCRPDIEPPVVRRFIDMEPIASMLVTGPGTVDDLIPLVRGMEKDLMARGVAAVEYDGLPDEEIALLTPAARLHELGMTLDELAARYRARLAERSGRHDWPRTRFAATAQPRPEARSDRVRATAHRSRRPAGPPRRHRRRRAAPPRRPTDRHARRSSCDPDDADARNGLRCSIAAKTSCSSGWTIRRPTLPSGRRTFDVERHLGHARRAAEDDRQQRRVGPVARS